MEEIVVIGLSNVDGELLFHKSDFNGSTELFQETTQELISQLPLNLEVTHKGHSIVVEFRHLTCNHTEMQL